MCARARAPLVVAAAQSNGTSAKLLRSLHMHNINLPAADYQQGTNPIENSASSPLSCSGGIDAECVRYVTPHFPLSSTDEAGTKFKIDTKGQNGN